jgi:hypothetical protein
VSFKKGAETMSRCVREGVEYRRHQYEEKPGGRKVCKACSHELGAAPEAKSNLEALDELPIATGGEVLLDTSSPTTGVSVSGAIDYDSSNWENEGGMVAG